MASAKADLVALCKSIDLIKELKIFQEIADEGRNELETIVQDFMQWMEATKLQMQAIHKDNKATNQVPLLPQTPTMKRRLRKRKIPSVEDEEKENTAITRPRRAASQAANSKFYNQLHLPTKMRRPSSPLPDSSSIASAQPTQKRPRVAKKLRINEHHEESDSDDDTISLASIASTKAGRKLQAQKGKTTDQEDETQDESTSSKKTVMTRGRKKAAAVRDLTESMQIDEASRLSIESVASTVAEPTSSRLRKFHEQPSINVERDTPTTIVPSTYEAKPKRVRKAKKKLSAMAEDKHSTDAGYNSGEIGVVQDMEISPTVVVEEITTSVTHAKVIQVHLERLPEYVTNTVVVTPAGTLVPERSEGTPKRESLGEQNITEDMELTMAVNVKTPVQAKKPATLLPSTSYELAALTPHLKGIVKERVIAVEKSLKKEEPVPKKQSAKKHPTSSKVDTPPINVSMDMFESAESSPEREPTPQKNKRSSQRRTSRQSFKTVMKAKRSVSTPAQGRLQVKLFDNNILQKRSMSQDELASSTSQGKTSTLGRSRVLTGMRTFIKPSAREVAQAALLEDEKRRKLEETLRIAERAREAARKKEEQLRLKKEQKKKENEDKRTRALLAQEAKAREQEEAARMEKEKEERKAALQRAREEKELKEKEIRREFRKQKQQEREQRRKEEEEARVAKAKEVASVAAIEMKNREEERKAEASKGGWAAPPAKLHTSKTAVKQIASAAVKNVFNETFEMPKSNAAGQRAPTQNTSKTAAVAAIASTSSNNCYAMTPSREEMPPMLPKNLNDYGVDDVHEDDPSDDDEKPKKIIPAWARNARRNSEITCCDYIRVGLRNRLFGTEVFKPTVEELFGSNARPVNRRSSAIWNTPPNIHHQSLCQSFMSD